jgi:hypothetical protein
MIEQRSTRFSHQPRGCDWRDMTPSGREAILRKRARNNVPGLIALVSVAWRGMPSGHTSRQWGIGVKRYHGAVMIDAKLGVFWTAHGPTGPLYSLSSRSDLQGCGF